ncbi:hypothetical protein Tco_1522570 [Tanacetum coccineum]
MGMVLYQSLQIHQDKLRNVDAIKSRFGGNDESKKMQKYILKQQFEGFSVSNTEGLHKGYDRFQSLLSQLEIHGAGVSTEDANQKFLRSLPSAWSQVSLIMRTKPGVDSLSFDDLYNNLRVFESDIKGSTASSSSPQNVAFVSENTSSTNDVYVLYRSIRSILKASWTIDGEGVDWTNHSEDEDYALMACNSSDSDTEREQLSDASIEIKAYSQGLKKVEAQLVAHQQGQLWFVTADGMHAVPPPMTGNYMPSGPEIEVDYSQFTYGLVDASILRSMIDILVKMEYGVYSKKSTETLVANSKTVEVMVTVEEHVLYVDSLNHLIRDCDFYVIRLARIARVKQWHMTGNKAYLAEFQDFNGGPIAFGGSKGYITGKGKIKRCLSFDLESYSDSGLCLEQILTQKSTTAGLSISGQEILFLGNAKNRVSIRLLLYRSRICCLLQDANPVYHSKTKHIAIRHHFIRDAYEKKLIQVLKIHTDDNVADLLTKAFDVSSSIYHALTVSPVVSTTFVEQFWTSAKSKIINNVRHITAKVAGKPVFISEASIRSDLLFDDANGIDSLPNQAIFDAIQLMGYEGDLTGKHFLGNVTPLFASMLVQPTEDEGATSERPSEAQPTPSPAHTSEMPFEPQPDSSPAHTSEVPIEPQTDLSPRPSPSTIIPDSVPETSGGNLGGHSSSDKSLSGNEGELALQSVYDRCLSLCAQVSDQAKEIRHLKQRLARKRSSKKQWVHKESVSKQGRKFAKGESSVQRNPLFDELDHMETENAQDVGRTRDIVGEEKENDEDVLSTDKEKVSTDKDKVSTDRPIVSTDRSKVSTDRQIKGTDEPKVSTDEQIEGTDEQRKDTDDHSDDHTDNHTDDNYYTDEQIEGTNEQRKDTNDHSEEGSGTQVTQTPTSTIFGDDETIAKVLLNMSQAKAVSREKEKGVELKDIEEIDRPRPTSTRSLLTLRPLPKIDPKDKGKKKIEEEDETDSESDDIPQAEKKFKQLESDEEMARKIQEEWEGEEERNRLAEEKATNEALIRNFDDIKARIEADRLLAERLQEQEREQFTIEERAKFLHDTIAAQRKFLAQQRSEAIRNRPPTKNQLRNQMMTYLKHVGNFKHAELKIKKFEEVQALYEKIKRSDEDFISIGSAEDERLIKRMNEKGVDSSKSEVIKEESKEEVQKESKEEESTRKRKLGTRKKMKSRKRRYIQNTSEDDSDKENDELRLHLTIAPDEEKEVDYEILDRKYPIKEWKTECLGTKPQTDQAEHIEEINQNVVIRSNGQKRFTLDFGENMSQAKAISREKEKGVELKDIEEIDRPRPTSIRSLLTLKPLPKIDPKDKSIPLMVDSLPKTFAKNYKANLVGLLLKRCCCVAEKAVAAEEG